MSVTSYGNPAHLLPPSWKSIITSWLAEDTPSFDCGGFVVGEEAQIAHLLAKQSGLLAGVPFFDEVFAQLGCSVKWLYKEGDLVQITKEQPKVKVATVEGPARCLLLGERVALNILARCSGIATKSDRLLKAARQAGYKGTVAGTRKTTPGFRLIEKYGMLIGGIDAHRYDLSSMVMLKDNHIWAKGSIPEAIAAARSVSGFSLKIDVECTSEEEAVQAIEAGADIIMLDNFTPEQISTSAVKLKQKYGNAKFLIEVSGGLTEENIASHVFEGVDILSTSSAHQSVQHVYFSLKIQPKSKSRGAA